MFNKIIKNTFVALVFATLVFTCVVHAGVTLTTTYKMQDCTRLVQRTYVTNTNNCVPKNCTLEKSGYYSVVSCPTNNTIPDPGRNQLAYYDFDKSDKNCDLNSPAKVEIYEFGECTPTGVEYRACSRVWVYSDNTCPSSPTSIQEFKTSTCLQNVGTKLNYYYKCGNNGAKALISWAVIVLAALIALMY